MLENRIKSKNVGTVRIFEIYGIFAGTFANFGKKAMRRSLNVQLKRNILFNLEDLKRMDESGVEAIIKNSANSLKCGLYTASAQILEAVQSKDDLRRITFINNEIELANFFGREFAERSIPICDLPERRQFVRLPTVLPLHIRYDHAGCMNSFFAVVTNISENGLFAEFIQSKAEDRAKTVLDPYDLPLLNLELHIPNSQILNLSGKLIHGDLSDGGIGLEFYGHTNEVRDAIRDWISASINQNNKNEVREKQNAS